MLSRMVPVLGSIAVAGAAAAFLTAAAAGSAGIPVSTTTSADVQIGASGLPIPRFVALRTDKVYARFGPSFDYPVAYEFEDGVGLPLKVIAEDRDNVWRRVEDRDGHRMWIHRSMLSANAHGVVTEENVILRAEPGDAARGRARLTSGVMTRIEACDADWCRIRADEFRGWVPKDALWGAPT